MLNKNKSECFTGSEARTLCEKIVVVSMPQWKNKQQTFEPILENVPVCETFCSVEIRNEHSSESDAAHAIFRFGERRSRAENAKMLSQLLRSIAGGAFRPLSTRIRERQYFVFNCTKWIHLEHFGFRALSARPPPKSSNFIWIFSLNFFSSKIVSSCRSVDWIGIHLSKTLI